MDIRSLERLCIRENCDNVEVARGLCQKHYQIGYRSIEAFPLPPKKQKYIIANKDKRTILLEGIRQGLSTQSACALAGISLTTFNGWIKKGKDNVDQEWTDFYLAVEQAKADMEQNCLSIVKDAIENGETQTRTTIEELPDGRIKKTTIINKTDKDVATAKWFLERRNEEYIRKSRFEDEVNAPISIKINFVKKVKKSNDDTRNGDIIDVSPS